ncbi:MAG: ROK family transcriptional regulator [Eubacteriales bacterium]|nr:ROK family transcriptional regulator [Eubacteriales bacterium]
MAETNTLQNNTPFRDDNNQTRILSLIRDSDGMTRAGIAEAAALSILTTKKYVRELIDEGIIIESGTEESTGGRKAGILKINPGHKYTLAADIGAHSVKIGIVRLDGSILENEYITAQEGQIPARIISVDELRKKLKALMQKHDTDKFIGLGIGVSGLADHAGGIIRFCPNISGWNNINVKDEFQDFLGIPAYVDTSARCTALAEQHFGAGKSIGNQVYVSIGYSISTGIIINSHLFRGAAGASGELGHVTAITGGSLCTCGNYGCLENYVTLPIIIWNIRKALTNYRGYSPLAELMALKGKLKAGAKDEAKTASGDDPLKSSKSFELEDVRYALEKGDKIVLNELSKAGDLLGTVLANMVNILNPELIILGGGVVENFPIIVDEVERSIRKQSLIVTYQNLSVKKSALGYGGAISGSALQVINLFFGQDPGC